jgi:hypothetical protein
LLIAGSAVSQQDSTDSIAWSRLFSLEDGRIVVSDGALMLDVKFANLPELPESGPYPASPVLGQYMAAERPDEYELDDLEKGRKPQTYEAPSGLTIAAKYIEFLQDKVPDASLRMQGDLDPVIIVVDGQAIGLVMAMKRETTR